MTELEGPQTSHVRVEVDEKGMGKVFVNGEDWSKRSRAGTVSFRAGQLTKVTIEPAVCAVSFDGQALVEIAPTAFTDLLNAVRGWVAARKAVIDGGTDYLAERETERRLATAFEAAFPA